MNGKTALFVLTIMVASFSSHAKAAELCVSGSKLTITGDMSEAKADGPGRWSVIPTETKPCIVSSLKGKGNVPTGCGAIGDYFVGYSFIASGTVSDKLDLDVTSISCKLTN